VRSLPTILLILSFPAGAIGYAVAAGVLAGLPLAEPAHGFLVLFGPLFIAGLVMVPFLVPFFDRKAKEDLAAYRRTTGSTADKSDDPPQGDGG
jgi:hypothetical protein